MEDEDFIADEELLPFVVPEINPSSSFDLENFSTLLLPAVDNKPLDATALRGVKNTLMESGSR